MTSFGSAAAIGTLRLTGAAADTPALRLRAARELAGADLSPPGLPPAAVLVIRRLADPLPRRLAGSELRLRPDAAWERAVRDRLAAMVHAAARPDGRGVVAPNAAAVVFADQAELLACAVREHVHGGLAERWWWRAVRRRLAVGAALGAGRDPSVLLAASPREAPAAIARLGGWGEAPAVAAALAPAGAARVLAALASEFGLPRDLVAGDGIAASDSMRGAASSARRAAAIPIEPWREWLPAVLRDAALAPEARCLFGVALGLAAAPHRLRAQETVRQARRWWRAVAAAESASARHEESVSSPTGAQREGEQPSAASRPLVDTATAATGRDLARDAHRGTAAGETPAALATSDSSLLSSFLDAASTAHSGDEPDDRRGSEEEEGGVGKATAVPAGDPRAPLDRVRRSPSVVVHELLPAELRRAGAAAESGTRAAVAPDAEATPAVESEPRAGSGYGEAVETRLAGVLYLIHALLDLGLPNAFERGWRLASDAGPWGTLDLLARGLLGAQLSSEASSPGAGKGAACLPPPGRRQAPPLHGRGSSPSSVILSVSEGSGVTVRGERPASDPVWRVLARLAAWPAAATPRRRAPALPAYRIPACWLAKLADPCGDFAWSSAGGRLRLWSAAAYLLADVPRDAGPPSRQAGRELARIAGARAADAARLVRRAASAAPLARPLPPLPRGCSPRLRRWLAAALPAVRRRLLLALTGGPATPAFAAALAQPPGTRGAAGDPIARALAAPGRIHLTASHLDLVVPLDAADLAVRRAGLDRDPGWLPAFGRVVSFHYE